MINTLHIFYNLKEVYEVSTRNCNAFEKALNSIAWENKFFADGEHHFMIGDMTFSPPSLDPFKISNDWEPSAMFDDGSYVSF